MLPATPDVSTLADSSLCPGCRPRDEADLLLVEPGWRLAIPLGAAPVAGWLVVEPIRHILTIQSLSPAELASLARLLARAAALIGSALAGASADHYCDGSGATHLRWDVVPRHSRSAPGAQLLVDGDGSSAEAQARAYAALRQQVRRP